jgi:signal transduction histidine kinase
MTTRSARDHLLLDAGIAVAVFAGSVGLLAVGDPDEGGGDVTVAAVLLAALASLPLVARRRRPLPVFLVTALASTALTLVAEPGGPPLGPTLALYWLAAATGDESRARRRLTLALVVTMLVAHVGANWVGNGFPVMEALFGVLLWGGAWLAGDLSRLRHERMAALEERALRAERETERERRLAAAEERGRIARDLHDSAGHAMNVILVHAGMGRLRAADDPESAREAFATIEEVARETVGDIDQLVRVLREDTSSPPSVEPPPGLAALGTLVERHRAAGLRLKISSRGERRALPRGVDRGAYRILQEALTNAARHGDGTAGVELEFAAGALEITVANPLGRDRTAPANGGGHGLVGMRERAALLGGSLEAGARDGQFRLHARLPFAAGRA